MVFEALPARSSSHEESVRALRRFLSGWGMKDTPSAFVAAGRLAAAARGGCRTTSPRELCERGARIGRAWIEDFARAAGGTEVDWLFRARRLLERYPRTFLETPIPIGPRPMRLLLLPEPQPSEMMQQSITDSVERLQRLIEAVAERLRMRRATVDARPCI